jgi:hypothetical protein
VVGDRGDGLDVESSCLVCRTRLNSEEAAWVGSRHDVLRRVEGSFHIVKRRILREETVLLARNLSNFF